MRVLFAGRFCNRLVERTFVFSSECLDQLRESDTVI
jgi:hypothetical protein